LNISRDLDIDTQLYAIEDPEFCDTLIISSVSLLTPGAIQKISQVIEIAPKQKRHPFPVLTRYFAAKAKDLSLVRADLLRHRELIQAGEPPVFMRDDHPKLMYIIQMKYSAAKKTRNNCHVGNPAVASARGLAIPNRAGLSGGRQFQRDLPGVERLPGCRPMHWPPPPVNHLGSARLCPFPPLSQLCFTKKQRAAAGRTRSESKQRETQGTSREKERGVQTPGRLSLQSPVPAQLCVQLARLDCRRRRRRVRSRSGRGRQCVCHLYFSTPIFHVFRLQVAQRARSDRPDSSQKAAAQPALLA
jgi:hypothetical protein